MGTYILKYSRGDEVKYISHLDFVRFIGRVVRRADIPFLYSQGFNPHPLLTVALPLSVGVTAEGELMKIGFDCDMPGEEIKKRLNDALPPGFKIEKAQKTEGKEFDLSRIDRAEYIVRCEMSRECDADTDAFLALDEIKVMKKSKSGIKEVSQ